MVRVVPRSMVRLLGTTRTMDANCCADSFGFATWNKER